MAAATVSTSTVTPHSFLLRLVFDSSGDGITITMAALQAMLAAGPLKALLSRYTDATCAALNNVGGTGGTPEAKKFRIYNVAGPAYNAHLQPVSARFTNSSGLVIGGILPAIATLYIGFECLLEFRYVNSNVR